MEKAERIKYEKMCGDIRNVVAKKTGYQMDRLYERLMARPSDEVGLKPKKKKEKAKDAT